MSSPQTQVPHRARFGDELPGLYLHLPFCSAICPYCDFSVLTGGPDVRSRFVDSLLGEIDLRSAERRWSFDTVYLGGGTPSILGPSLLERLLGAVAKAFDLRPETTLAMEANPEDATPESLAAWRDLGISVLSLGVQSFDADVLRFLGRRHDPSRSRRSVDTALATGFDVVSVDLIFGLPDDSAERWGRDLDAVVDLGPHHVSCYQLTIHEGTPFGFRARRGELAELAEGAQARLYRLAHERLAEAGYEAYEVSNFARSPAFRSRHNRKYWRHVPYLGLGPSSHSFDGRFRWWNERKIKPWTGALDEGRLPEGGREELGPAELATERLLLGIRTVDGVDLEAIREELGIDLRSPNEALIERLVAEGLVRDDDGTILPTSRGLAVADGMAAAFALPDSPSTRPGSASQR